MGMKCSDLLLALVLAVLAYLVFLLLNNCPATEEEEDSDTFTNNETFANGAKCAGQVNTLATTPETPLLAQQQAYGVISAPVEPVVEPVKAEQMTNKIRYEPFANVEGLSESIHGAAPFKDNAPVMEGNYSTVNYTGLAEAEPGEVLQIEGTDLLTAPLVDNMLYTNSIANTNRNASQDLRGDIPLQYNENYTPFYSSTIWGAPLSQHAMTIGNVSA